MPRRPKGPTRDERRSEALRQAGDAQAALLDPAFKDASFVRLYASAVLAIATGQSQDEQVVAIERVLGEVQRFVPVEDVELAADALAEQVVYEAYLRAGRTHEKAVAAVRAAAGLLAQVPRTQPRRYPVAPGNPAFFDQRGELHTPLGLSAAQRDEVRRFEDDVAAERPRRGHPTGLEMSAEEFRTKYVRVVADLKRTERATTQQNIATHMPMTIGQLRRHLRRYGTPAT